MTNHDYTASSALEMLLRKLRTADGSLANLVQAAIDSRKDIVESEALTDRRKKARVYRKRVPYSTEEALQVAMNALQAYFVEQPMFVESAAQNFARAAIGSTVRELRTPIYFGTKTEEVILQGQGEAKSLVVELRTETQIRQTGEDIFELKRVQKEDIDTQQRDIAALRELLNFRAE